ncbi:MAG: hypothetical protein ACJAZ2_002411, partial [Glaciecola sp.]
PLAPFSFGAGLRKEKLNNVCTYFNSLLIKVMVMKVDSMFCGVKPKIIFTKSVI